jgi:hypothetical protein
MERLQLPQATVGGARRCWWVVYMSTLDPLEPEIFGHAGEGVPPTSAIP